MPFLQHLLAIRLGRFDIWTLYRNLQQIFDTLKVLKTLLLMPCHALILILSIHRWISPNQLADAQQSDEELSQVKASTSLQFCEVLLPLSNKTIICDTSTGNPRPYVPALHRGAVFDSLHSVSHPGIRATQKLITQHFIWPGMNKEIRQWTKVGKYRGVLAHLALRSSVLWGRMLRRRLLQRRIL